MPELPEVEIMRRNLVRWTADRRVERVVCRRLGTLAVPGEGGGVPAMAGRRMVHVYRRGKVMWMAAAGGVGWLVRFGMTGKWVRVESGSSSRFARVILHLDDGTRVAYEDRRNLGRICEYRGEDGAQLLRRVAPGIDPLEEALTAEDVKHMLGRRRGAIKPWLLDQSLIAGIGNIYSSEVLFATGIHPRRLSRSLSDPECRRLAEEIPVLLRWAIDVFDGEKLPLQGEPGVPDLFRVYRRAGAPCVRCGHAIEREVVSGRASFYCPRCQPFTP